jgi:hypothetical protein
VTFRKPGHKRRQARDFVRHGNRRSIRTRAFAADINNVGARPDLGFGLRNRLFYIQAAVAGKRIIIDVNDAHH